MPWPHAQAFWTTVFAAPRRAAPESPAAAHAASGRPGLRHKSNSRVFRSPSTRMTTYFARWWRRDRRRASISWSPALVLTGWPRLWSDEAEQTTRGEQLLDVEASSGRFEPQTEGR